MPLRSPLALLLLLGCGVERIELVGDAARPTSDTGQPDTGDTTDGGVTTDAGMGDTGAADTGVADTGAADTGGTDAGPADTGTACVCRLASCRTNPDCAVVGPGSTCVRMTCTGGAGSCTSDSECGAGWICTQGPASLDPC